MAQFDRFDICEAYFMAEMLYNEDGWLKERPSNQRRKEACSLQLRRVHFRPSPVLGEILGRAENGLEIYNALITRLGLPS